MTVEIHNTGGPNERKNTDSTCASTSMADCSPGCVDGEDPGSTIHAIDCPGYDVCHVTDLMKS